MYLKRKKLECDGIYQATAYREKRSGTHGLKAGGYFISEQVSRMMEVEFRTFDVTKMRSSTSSPMSRSTSQNSLSRSSSPKLSTSSGRSFDCSTPDRGRVVSASPSHITPTRATIVARDVREHVSNSSAHPSPMYYIVPSPASSRISENHALTSAPPSGGSFGTQHTHLPQAPVVYFVSPEQIYHLQNIRADVPPPRMAATFPVGVSNRVWNTAASPNVAQAPSGLFEHPGAYNGLPVMQPGVWDSNSSPVDLTRRPEP